MNDRTLVAATLAAALLGGCATPAGHAPASPLAETAEERAADLVAWRERCDRGFAVDCRKLGWASLSGAGVPKDDRLAAAYLMKGCEVGEPGSCSDLGVLTILGRGVAQDDAVGGALSRRACDAGYALACSNVGTLAVEGVGRPAPRPDERARAGGRIVRLFQTACDAGVPEGCLNLGTALERGLLVSRDLPGAALDFRRACDAGLAIACHRLALLAGRAPEAAPEADVAALGAIACRAGVVPACTQPGVAPGAAGPQTPTARLMSDPGSYALGIPGAGGFHPTDLAQLANGSRGGQRSPRAAGPDQAPATGGGEQPDQAVELLIRLRRGQLATCLERERTTPAAVQLSATFTVDRSGRPGRLRATTEPSDPALEACALEVIGAWSFPVAAGGWSGPHQVRFGFEAMPPGLAPEFASPTGLRPVLTEPGCVERRLRVPEAYRGAESAIAVKLVVDQDGKPVLFHALTLAPEPLVAAVGEAVRACAFTPGVGEDGQTRSIWMTMTVRVDQR